MQGFESWTKPLMIDYFISKDKRQNMMQSGINYYGMQSNPMVFPGMPGQFVPYSNMMPIPMPNQYNQPYMYNQGNYKNNGYNNYRPKYNNNGYQYRGRGSHRGGYHKNNNYQKKNNNNNDKNENSTNTNVKEEKKEFDFESFNKLTTIEEKKEFLGERLFAAIQENPNIAGQNIDIEIIGKITGMIIEIPDEKEIIEILQKPSALDSRIKEALALLNKNK
jgi:hypothetical protein